MKRRRKRAGDDRFVISVASGEGNLSEYVAVVASGGNYSDRGRYRLSSGWKNWGDATRSSGRDARNEKWRRERWCDDVVRCRAHPLTEQRMYV